MFRAIFNSFLGAHLREPAVACEKKTTRTILSEDNTLREVSKVFWRSSATWQSITRGTVKARLEYSHDTRNGVLSEAA